MNMSMSKSKILNWSLALLAAGVIAGCDSGGGGAAADPTAAAGLPFATTNNSTAAGAVNLGTAASFVILSKAAVSTTGTTAITGHVGVSPAAETFLTGFSQARDATNEFSTSSLVTGRLYAADMAPPTPANMTTAISDMETAYTDAAGRAPVGAALVTAGGDIGGLTIPPGVYVLGGTLINSNVTLNGGPGDVWIFKISGTLTQANGTRVNLAGGALPKNIFWQVTGNTTLGTTAHFEGIVLGATTIALNTGATVNGRLYSQTNITLDANTVAQPAP